jgi:predicted nucleotidyltransferase component of viral defense system
MISLNDILEYYPPNLHAFKRFILREYLQHKILEILYESEFGKNFCFLGGTCLRIVHNNTRFSEDLDFDNFNLTEEHFSDVKDLLKNALEKEGYEVEMKLIMRGAWHCYIRFPGILFNEGLSGFREEKILIQLDTEPQFYNFVPERFILNKFQIFAPILVTPKDLLLAQKLFAIINRTRNKGRDFFDVVFLLGLGVKPDYRYIDAKLNISNPAVLKDALIAKVDTLVMEEMAKDVEPFLFQPKDVKKIIHFRQLIEQETL